MHIVFDKPVPVSLERRYGTATPVRGAEQVSQKAFKYKNFKILGNLRLF